MQKELLNTLAKRMKVSRQTRWNWEGGLSKDAKEYLAAHSKFESFSGRYVMTFNGNEYLIAPVLWGELKGLKELRASVKLLKEKERKSVKTKA